jgi:5-enolpyruvylshikimate-3-phosphate synthase
VGVRVEEYENEIKIWKKFVIPEDKMFYFETGNDHRLAMSLSVMATYLKKLHPEKRFIIDDKSAV